MKKLLLTGIVAAAMMVSNAQTYTAVGGTGVTDYDLATMLGTGTKIMDKTTNDALTPTQTIPFNFNFYGTNVTQFKASDNGYITFNTSASTSVKTNSNLPDVGEPNNSIYAFWNDWELKAAPNPSFVTAIITRTAGVAPNRKFFIQWFGASPMGKAIAANADVLAFGIVLYENGNGLFEVYFNGSYGASSNTGACGLENSDGSNGVLYSTGTSFAQPFTSATDAASYPKISFYPSSMPAEDLAVTAVDFPGAISKSTAYNVKGSIINLGKTDITNITLNYSLDGGTPVTSTINSLSVRKAGGVYNFSHPTVINEASGGALRKLKVWVSKVNGNSDANPSNDTGKSQFIVINGTSAPKTVLVEEATGAWCQHCPDAHTYIDQIIEDYPGKAVIAVHHNSDGMTNPESDIVNAAYATGYPSGFIDRTLYSGQATVGLNRGLWNSTVSSQANAYTPAKVNIKNVSYNGTTRLISYDVEAEFSDYYAGDIRLGAMVKEASIRGTGNQYDQVISSVYTGNSSHIYFGYKTPMGGYYHKNVIISIPSGAWGSAGSIPSSVIPTQKVSKTFTYTLPSMTNVTIPTSAQFSPKGAINGKNKPMEIWLVGFIAKYDASATKREVLNVSERQMWDVAAGISNLTANNIAINAYPNPASNAADVEFTLPESQKVVVTVTNALGQIVSTQIMDKMNAGSQAVKVSTENMPNGIYNVSVVSSGVSGSCKLMVVH